MFSPPKKLVDGLYQRHLTEVRRAVYDYVENNLEALARSKRNPKAIRDIATKFIKKDYRNWKEEGIDEITREIAATQAYETLAGQYKLSRSFNAEMARSFLNQQQTAYFKLKGEGLPEEEIFPRLVYLRLGAMRQFNYEDLAPLVEEFNAINSGLQNALQKRTRGAQHFQQIFNAFEEALKPVPNLVDFPKKELVDRLYSEHLASASKDAQNYARANRASGSCKSLTREYLKNEYAARLDSVLFSELSPHAVKHVIDLRGPMSETKREAAELYLTVIPARTRMFMKPGGNHPRPWQVLEWVKRLRQVKQDQYISDLHNLAYHDFGNRLLNEYYLAYRNLHQQVLQRTKSPKHLAKLRQAFEAAYHH
jgi:hypothetical protein